MCTIKWQRLRTNFTTDQDELRVPPRSLDLAAARSLEGSGQLSLLTELSEVSLDAIATGEIRRNVLVTSQASQDFGNQGSKRGLIRAMARKRMKAILGLRSG
jgi:hypothetical protein